MIHCSFISKSELTTLRLDGEFYSPEYIRIEELIKKYSSGYSALGGLVTDLKDGPGGWGVSTNDYTEFGIPVIRGTNIKDNIVDLEGCVFISEKKHQELKAHEVNIGDVVLSVRGTIGRSAVFMSDTYDHASINAAVVRMRCINGCMNPYYLVAFFNSYHGRMQTERIGNGAVQNNMNLTETASNLIPMAEERVQKYIGDKIRQAERLRTWTKILEAELNKCVAEYQPEQKLSSSLVSRVSTDLLTDMLTATTYRGHYIKNQKNLRAHGKTFSVFEYLASVTNGFDERDELVVGLPYVKVADVKQGYIDLRSAPKVRNSALENASIKQRPKLGDLLLTRKGSFGIAAVVMEHDDFLCSSEVFCCKPKKHEYMPILAWFLNSLAGNMQFWQYSTGTTMPGINQENLGSILVPDFFGVDLEKFNLLYELRYKAKKYSEQLAKVAKYLVEYLIEGLIDERLLIAAELALGYGDNSLDRNILSRLKADGLDGKGDSLFSDLDHLYDLLDQAEQAMAV